MVLGMVCALGFAPRFARRKTIYYEFVLLSELKPGPTSEANAKNKKQIPPLRCGMTNKKQTTIEQKQNGSHAAAW
jgi:hypothetical protein